MIRIADYPQLKDAAWYIADNAQFTDEEALAFYERNWKYIEEDKRQPNELALIHRLVEEIGHGILNV